MPVWETIRFVVVDVIASILYFPVWWYTVGLLKVARRVWTQISGLIASLNLKILFRFLLKPMFGQSDWIGRAISIYVRIFHFLILFVYATVVTVFLTIVLILWIILPPFLLISILYHLGLDIPYYG